MSYLGNIFHEYVNVPTLDKYRQTYGGVCVVVAKGVGMFNYAYMRKTVLDILPAGQDQCSCWCCFEGKLAVGTNEHLKRVSRMSEVPKQLCCIDRMWWRQCWVYNRPFHQKLQWIQTLFQQNSQTTVCTKSPQEKIIASCKCGDMQYFLIRKCLHLQRSSRVDPSLRYRDPTQDPHGFRF